jgi:hypothetical protein
MSENGREVIGYREPKCELKCELELAKWSVDGAHIRKTELKCELVLAFDELAFELAFWLLRISLMPVFPRSKSDFVQVRWREHFGSAEREKCWVHDSKARRDAHPRLIRPETKRPLIRFLRFFEGQRGDAHSRRASEGSRRSSERTGV